MWLLRFTAEIKINVMLGVDVRLLLGNFQYSYMISGSVSIVPLIHAHGIPFLHPFRDFSSSQNENERFELCCDAHEPCFGHSSTNFAIRFNSSSDDSNLIKIFLFFFIFWKAYGTAEYVIVSIIIIM